VEVSEWPCVPEPHLPVSLQDASHGPHRVPGGKRLDGVAKQFFGVEADAYTRIYEDPSLEAQLQQIHKRVLWRRMDFRLRAKKEVWQDVERVTYHVDDVSSIAFAKDARHMLTEVKAALATGQI